MMRSFTLAPSHEVALLDEREDKIVKDSNQKSVNQMTEDDLELLMARSIDNNNVCTSMLEIQDLGFQLVRIEKKMNAIIRFLKKRVKPLLDDIDSEKHNSK